MRGTHLSTDGVAGFQIEFADLGGRDINVVRPRKIVVIRRAEESSRQAISKHALGRCVLLFALRLEDLEYQILLAQPATGGQRSGDLGQLGNIFSFSSAMVIDHLRRFSKAGRWESLWGTFGTERRGWCYAARR